MSSRRRTPAFRAPLRVGTVGLYPLHVVLGAFVAGLVAGPRSVAVVLVLVAGFVVGASLAVRRRVPFSMPLPVGEERLIEGVETVARPTVVHVPAVRVVWVAIGAGLAVLAGAVLADARLAALDRTVLRPASDVRAVGFVTEPPRVRSFGTTVVPLRIDPGRLVPPYDRESDQETVLVRIPDRVRAPRVRVGDELVVRGDLRRLGRHEAFERRRGVHAVLEAERVAATGRRRRSVVDALRRRAEDALARGQGSEQAALALGMVLGQDQALPEDLREAFRTSGLAHLLAASGQNVMLLAALVLALLTALGVPLRIRLGVAVAAVLLYVPLAGAGPSIQRAGVMGAAALVAAMASRPASRAYALLLAAAVTLAANPRAAEEVGWQLSFAAVIAILALHGRIRGALVRRGTPVPLADLLAVTVAATAGTAPLLSLYFGQVSLVSLPANVLAAPAVAPVMWLGTLAGAVGGPVAELLNGLAAFPLAYLAWLARAVADLPHASIGAELPGPVAVSAAYLLLGAALYVGPRVAVRRDVAVPLGVVVVAAALLLAPGPPRPPEGPTLSVLDVGQGDAVLLQDGPHAVLFDTGRSGEPLVRELRGSGVERLEAVVVTHSSSDHEGGLPALLEAMPVGLVLDGRGPGREHGGEGGGARFEGLPPGQRRGIPAAGQAFRVGRIGIEILWPPPGERRLGDPNLTATVALARTGDTTALLTADAESPVTLPLDLAHVDVLKIAHHGSADTGLPALLERLRPRTAVIPVGRNTYGHPAPSTLRALRAVPDVRRTDRDGTVRVPLLREAGRDAR